MFRERYMRRSRMIIRITDIVIMGIFLMLSLKYNLHPVSTRLPRVISKALTWELIIFSVLSGFLISHLKSYTKSCEREAIEVIYRIKDIISTEKLRISMRIVWNYPYHLTPLDIEAIESETKSKIKDLRQKCMVMADDLNYLTLYHICNLLRIDNVTNGVRNMIDEEISEIEGIIKKSIEDRVKPMEEA